MEVFRQTLLDRKLLFLDLVQCLRMGVFRRTLLDGKLPFLDIVQCHSAPLTKVTKLRLLIHLKPLVTRARAVTRSENKDFVLNSEFLPKTFRFVPIFRTHFKIDSKWFSKPKNVLNLFWILSLLVFSTISRLNVTYIQKMFWICSEVYTLWIFQLGNKTEFWY